MKHGLRLWFLAAFYSIVFYAHSAEPALVPGYESGKHYQEIKDPQPSTGDNIEVMEVFWYGCPHCYDFEPYLNRWLSTKPADVEFRRLPAIFDPSWSVHAKVYYTAEALGVLDKIHSKIFDALHKSKRPLHEEAALSDFFAENGVEKAAFNEVFHSFSIEGKVQQAAQSVRQYKLQSGGPAVKGVPAVIVNGRYITSGAMAGSYDDLLKVMDFLVESERQRLQPAK